MTDEFNVIEASRGRNPWRKRGDVDYRKAEELQEQLKQAAWARFEAVAPQRIQEQLSAVPDLRAVVECGIQLGIIASFEFQMRETARDVPNLTAHFKSLTSDLHELLGAARSQGKRVLSVRAVERLLVKYR